MFWSPSAKDWNSVVPMFVDRDPAVSLRLFASVRDYGSQRHKAPVSKGWKLVEGNPAITKLLPAPVGKTITAGFRRFLK